MQYKVLALDLDGTLTNNAKVITPRTKAALQAAADRGVRIVLASGRPTVGIEPLAKELELDRRGGCILSYNGGKIIDCKTGETLVQHEFPPELIDPVCTFARYWNVMPLTYDAKGIVTEDAANPIITGLKSALDAQTRIGTCKTCLPRSSGPSTSCCWLATLWICPMWRS